jgi:hypothetical protein
VILLALLVACGKRERSSDPEPVAPGSPADLPEVLRLDWQSLRYDLGSLGSVKATGALTQFGVTEDELGGVHATQDPTVHIVGTGALDLDAPVLVDLDGDHHDESLIPFELRSKGGGSVYGVFVFALRAGQPVQLGVVTTTGKHAFSVEGNAIKTAEGALWRWDAAQQRLVN